MILPPEGCSSRPDSRTSYYLASLTLTHPCRKRGVGGGTRTVREKRTFCATEAGVTSSLKSARRETALARSGGPDATGARPGQPFGTQRRPRFRLPGRNVVDVA